MFSFDDLLKKQGKPLVMGILNITPDSFSDGGQAFSSEAVISKVKALCYDGVHIIDVGACSTAPNNTVVSESEEIRRIEMFLPSVIEFAEAPVSVDTFRSSAARCAVSLGAQIINDESGAFSPETAELVKTSGCGWIFMHTGNKSSSEEGCYEKGVTADVISFFNDMKRKAIAYGISPSQLAFDCGIGFGKSREDDLELLANCDIISEFSPLLIGVSRKRIIGELTGESNPSERVEGSVAVAKLLAEDGAAILRVHDVKETVQVIT